MDNTASRIFAVLAYLLSVPGALGVLLLRRQDRLAAYHAKQSLGLALLGALAFLTWAIIGWIVAWIPYIGFLLAVALFALVISAIFVLCGCWLVGLKFALHGTMQPLPVVGGLIARLLTC